MRFVAGLAAVSLFAMAGAAMAQPENVELKDGAWVTTDGWPLYTFANDTEANVSACSGQCITNWPALAAADDATDDGDWVVITRDDGSKQWSYKGKPLYTFARDTAGSAATGVSERWPLAVE